MKKKFDVVIIGAGIVGTAIARELSKYEIKIAVIEKEADASFGISKANSGIVHAGFHSAPEMLKTKLCVRGNELYGLLQEELNIPFKRVGELMVARSEEEVNVLESYMEQGSALGIPDLSIISGDALKAVEPHLSKSIIAALSAPSAGVTNPYEFVYRLLQNAMQNGTKFYSNSEVIAIEEGKVVTPEITFEAPFIINAAGLFSDKIADMAGVKNFDIHPRKGEEYILDKKYGGLVRHIIFPLPTAVSKGVLVIPTLDGTIMIGPSATDTTDRESLSTTNEQFSQILKNTRSIIPAIQARQVISAFSGLRCVATGDDFIIGPTPLKGFINAAGIQSPGLTAAPAIAELFPDILATEGLELKEKSNFKSKVPRHIKIKDLDPTALDALVKKDPLYGKVICRCERVSEAEIRQAIREGATTLDGIKLRTRSGMGRCQGGFCSFRILEIMAEEMGVDVLTITKKGPGSEMLMGDLKK